jgi:Transposase IS4
MGLSELKTFQQLLTLAIIDQIVIMTNSYVINARNIEDFEEELKIYARSWKSVDSTDIWWFIGYLLYMGAHKEAKYEEH